MNISFKVSGGVSRLINKWQDAAIEDMKRELAEKAGDDMNNYVPMETGALRGSMEATSEAITWGMYPYNFPQYYGHAGSRVFRNYTTPGTGPFWNEVATGNHMPEWENVVLRRLV